MSENDDRDVVHEVLEQPMVPTETPHPDRREHAKTPHRLDDDELAERTQHEREQVQGEGAAEA